MWLEETGFGDAIFADELHVEAGQINEKSGLYLVHALLQNVFGFGDGDVGVVVAIHHRHGEERPVAVGGERLFVHRGQVVHVKESRSVVFVPAADEEVDVVGSARTKEIRQILASVMSRRFRGKVVSVAVFVQLHVFADELGKLEEMKRVGRVEMGYYILES